ncbi:MAG: ABC transporter ATP-binding protein [Ruminococcaceae bacterium]|nr:ABC transporter ATP-binding protein [Oscillospiraceae bacterium]
MEHKKTDESYIPDYQSLFEDDPKHTGGGGRVLKKLLKENRRKIYISSLYYIVKASPVWVIPVITASIINAVTDGNEVMGKVWMYMGILLVLLLQNIPMHVMYARYTDSMLRTVGAGLRNTLIKKLQHLSISYHKEIESGRVQSKFMRDVEAIEFLNAQLIKSVLPSIIGIAVSMGITIYKSPLVALFFLAVVPVNVILVRVFNKRMRETNRHFRKESEDISAKVATMLEMIPVTKAHGLESLEIHNLEENITKLKLSGLMLDKTNAYFGSITWVISHLLSALCLLFTAFLAIKGYLPAGDIVIFQTYFTSISNSVQNLVNIYPQLTKGLESIKSVSEIVLSDKVEDNRGKQRIKELKGDIEFKNVSFRYPDGDEDVIKKLSFTAKAGECIAFVGASGSGKSTVMNMIIGFLLATEGQVLIDGKDIKTLNLSSYRHHISVVPQSSILFTGTVKDNITYGMAHVSPKELARVTGLANIDEFLPRLSHGVETVIGEHGDKLSGGQKQRISIARAIIRDPEILILDEATSALDNYSEYLVQQAINGLVKNRTTFVVAHRLSTIRNADRIIVMEDGVAVEMGTYDELMAKQGKFYKLKVLSEVKPWSEDVGATM